MLGVNQYGKAETHLVRVVRDGDVHELRDLLVSVALSGALEAVHLEGDNRAVLATDTQKNTVYAFAKEFGVGTPEEFATLLARHFLGGAITQARVEVVEVAWARLGDHAFVAVLPRAAGRDRDLLRRRGVVRLGRVGSRRAQDHRLRVPRLPARSLHDAGRDVGPRAGHGGVGALAP